jgi:hypothetical protein
MEIAYKKAYNRGNSLTELLVIVYNIVECRRFLELKFYLSLLSE